eukprot:TRINITY_DN12932_c0_g1_i2.p1 TRINITY_DN12932_c0_g1~~TRINITY_DN12932_c0_g1_i2.p1  ORF type:complete len:252 (-),score=31.18 TRINITY_DN12932_c0_g1_i2:93-848(-)
MGFTQIIKIQPQLFSQRSIFSDICSRKLIRKPPLKCCASFPRQNNKNNNSVGNSRPRQTSFAVPSSVPRFAPLFAALVWVCRGGVVAQSNRLKGLANSLKESRLLFGDQDLGHHGKLYKGGGIGMTLLSITSSAAKQKISPVLETLGANRTFMSGFLAWMFAQILKVFTTFVVERRWDLKMLVSSGGMPSSHAALCVGLTTSVALCHGVSDALFPVCLGFSLIVMYDAAGVRRHAGLQAAIKEIAELVAIF